VTVPAEFEFQSEFRRNGNYNLAGTSAKFPFPWNSWNHLDSRGFHLEYVGDCKELLNQLGEQVILPSSYIGGPRDMHQRYLDVMAITRYFKKIDIFLTMTTNPNWPEITRELLPG